MSEGLRFYLSFYRLLVEVARTAIILALLVGLGVALRRVLAVPAALYVSWRHRGERAVAVAWNLLGIVDLLTAVTLGTLMTARVAQTAAAGVPSLLSAYPTVMTPAFAVPLSLILHGLSLWQTQRRWRESPIPEPTLRSAQAAPHTAG